MEKANFGQIVSFLFGIANDCLVDTYDVGDYRKIILPMMVIRRFDAVLEPTKEKVLKMKEQLDAAGITDQDEALCSVAGEAFCNSSPYTLSDLKSRTNQQQLKSDFILYLNGFSQNVQDIIKRFEFRNQIDKLSEHDILGLLISKFTDSSVNLSNRPIYDAKGNLVQPALDNHTMGTVFEEVIRIFFGSTISNDGFSGETFDFMLSNPPFGTPWKTDLKAWGDIKKDEITDTRFRVNYKGEDFSLIPDIGDPQMLFLANNISKMKKNTVLGSRIVEVHNSSSLSTGKAGSGPSNLRQYIIEQDMLEAIVALPEEMFYNTPITTYIWVLTNKKDVKRKGKVQLIDATKIKTSLRKNLGNKKFEISKELRSKILDIYMGFDQADSKLSKIVDNSDFGYWEVPIMHPLYDENGKIVVETKGKNKGKPKADKDLTDKNRVQFSYAGGVEAFYSEEVKPYSPDAWIDWDNIKIGYDISFTKYFYDPEDLRDALDIVSDLNNIHSESTQTLEKIIEHAKGNAVLQTTNMKDSGNKWLGKIPAHWDLVYLWQICAEQKNKNSQNQENNVLSLSHGNIIRKKDLNYGLVPKDYVGYQIVEPGNIILRLTDLQNDQKSLRTALVREKGIITSAYVCLKTTQNPRFIQLILHVYDINKYFYGLGGGVRQSIGYQELKNMVIPIPPEEEQKKIVDFVDTKCASVGFEIDRMIEQLKQEIALLGQYKTQMAADIITGRTNLSEIDYALISDVPTDHTEEVAEDAE